MKEKRQFFCTFNEIMQQTFDKTKYGTRISTNIEILKMQELSWDYIFWNADPFNLMRLSYPYSTSDANFDIVTDMKLLSTCFIAWKWPFLLLDCLPPEYQFAMLYKLSIGYKSLILGNQLMHDSFTYLLSFIQFLE